MKISRTDFNFYWNLAIILRMQTPQLRTGQSFYIVLHKHNETLAESIKDTDCNMFYATKNIDNFIKNHVE